MLIFYLAGISLLVLVAIIAWRYRLVDTLKKFWEPPISSSINDVFPHFRGIEDYPPQPVPDKMMDELARTGTVSLGPGVYDFYLQGFCLDAGKYAPDSESIYLVAPLKGKRSNAIQLILKNSLKDASITQKQIQTLIWAITSGIKYREMGQEVQALANRLLPEKELILLGKYEADKILKYIWNTLLTEIKSRLPQEVLGTIKTINKIKEKLSDASTTYEELETIAIRPGKAPVTKNIPDVKPGEWSLTDRGYYMRVFPKGYSRVRAQVYVPKRYDSYVEKDELRRITRIGIKDGIGIKIKYEDDPAKSKLTLNDGKEIPIWSFKKLEFSIPTPKSGGTEVFEADNIGWIAKNAKELAALDPQKYPEIKGRIESAKDIAHDVGALRNILARASSKSLLGVSLQDGGGQEKNVDQPTTIEKFIEDIESGKIFSDAIEAIEDDLIDTIKEGYPVHDAKIKWLKEFFKQLKEVGDDAINRINKEISGSDGKQGGGDSGSGGGSGEQGGDSGSGREQGSGGSYTPCLFALVSGEGPQRVKPGNKGA